MGARWPRGLRHVLLLLVATVLLCMVPGTTVHAADDACHVEQLKSARVTASVRFEHEGEDFTKAEGRLTVKVPKSWGWSADLLLNGDTERFRTAMRCLLRYPDDPFPYRDTEGRAEPPTVTVEEDGVRVDQRVTTWVVNLQTRHFGPWSLPVGHRHLGSELTTEVLHGSLLSTVVDDPDRAALARPDLRLHVTAPLGTRSTLGRRLGPLSP